MVISKNAKKYLLALSHATNIITINDWPINFNKPQMVKKVIFIILQSIDRNIYLLKSKVNINWFLSTV